MDPISAGVRMRSFTGAWASGKIGRYFTANPKRAKPAAMIMRVTENSVHFGV